MSKGGKGTKLGELGEVKLREGGVNLGEFGEKQIWPKYSIWNYKKINKNIISKSCKYSWTVLVKYISFKCNFYFLSLNTLQYMISSDSLMDRNCVFIKYLSYNQFYLLDVTLNVFVNKSSSCITNRN